MSQNSDQYVYNILMNNRSSALLSVAVDLKLFDFIKLKKSVDPNDISNHFKFSLRGADAVLVGLTCLKLLKALPTNDPNDWYRQRYTLDEISTVYLTSDSPLYLGNLV